MQEKAKFHLLRAWELLEWLLAKAGAEEEELAPAKRQARNHLMMCKAYRTA